MKIVKSLLLLLFIGSNVSASAPAGYYYRANGKQKAALKSALHQIIKEGERYKYGSGSKSTWEGFNYTDKGDNNAVIDIYSDEIRYFTPNFGSVAGMHIEHCLPKSWWGGVENNAYKDLYHLYPSDGSINISKSNNPLGEVTGTPVRDNGVSKMGKNGFGGIYNNNCFEPADQYKGDFARTYLYMVTAYEDYAPLWSSPMMSNNRYPVWNKWSIELLLKWHRQDPVSDKELKRTEEVYKIQGNRNPFIDYPELAEYIWGKDTLQSYFLPQESGSFLLAPRSKSRLDFGVLMVGNQNKLSLPIEGVNITDNITLTLQNQQNGFTLSQESLSKEEVLSGTTIELLCTPNKTGILTDTLLISGGGLELPSMVYLEATVTTLFVSLPATEASATTLRANWITDSTADFYLLDLYRGNTQATDLVISTYLEGSSWNKVIELYNATGKDIDLSQYSLRKQNNGTGPLGWELQLDGILADEEYYIIAHNQASPAIKAVMAKENSMSIAHDCMTFNGDDAIALYHGGIMIDIVGIKDGGPKNNWGVDITLSRKPSQTSPSSIYDEQQWLQHPKDDIGRLLSFKMDLEKESESIIKAENVGLTTSHLITGLKPDTEYFYTIYAHNSQTGQTQSAMSPMSCRTMEIEPPTLLPASGIHNSGFALSWNKVVGISQYLVTVGQVVAQADTTWIMREQLVENSHIEITGLEAESPYIYRVSSTAQGVQSLATDWTTVETNNIASSVESALLAPVHYWVAGNKLHIHQPHTPSSIHIYTANGNKIASTTMEQSEAVVALPYSPGIYIVSIQNKQHIQFIKIIL